MPRTARGIVAALAIVVGVCSERADAQDVRWRSDYAAARKEATETGRPLLLDFGTEDCFYCRKLDATTFRVPVIVKQLNEQFIPLKINAERAESLTRALGVDSYPTLVVATADGRIVGRHVGYGEATQIRALLDKAPARVVTPAPAVVKEVAVGQLALAQADHDAGRYLACLKRCERLVEANGPDSADARRLAQRITSDLQKWQLVREQLDADLGTLQVTLAAPLIR